MILDNEQKLAFIHIPHCAGSNLKIQLLKNPERFKVYIPEIIPEEYKSIADFNSIDPTLVELTTPIDHLPAKYTPPEYSSIAFIKNTYHREVSRYSMLCAYQNFFNKFYFQTFKQYLNFVYFTDPNTVFLKTTTGVMRSRGCYDYCYSADYVYKIEDINDVWSELSKKYNLPKEVWDSRFNVQTKGDWREYYDQECIDIVAKFRKKDLDAFGYTFA